MDQDNDKISDSELKKIDELLKQTEGKKLNLRKKKKKLSLSEKQQLAVSINNKLNEHIDSYILIGFDVHGNDVIIVNSANEMENRALRNLVEDFLMPFDVQDVQSAKNLEDEDDDDAEF